MPSDKKVKVDVASAFTLVPCVEGNKVAQAIEKLKQAGLGYEQIPTAEPGTVGSVVRQNPRAGVCGPNPTLKVAGGSKVTLFVKQ
jgi:beta-lactam-binding protein with PASTA domain